MASSEDGERWHDEGLIPALSGAFGPLRARVRGNHFHDPEYFKRNRLFVGNNAISLPGGGIATPLRIAVAMAEESGETDAIPPLYGIGNVRAVSLIL